MNKPLLRIAAALLFLGAAPRARGASTAGAGGPVRAAVASVSLVARCYPGWGPAVRRLVGSREGRVMARFEKDFKLAGREDSPLLEYVDILAKKGHAPESVGGYDARARDSLAREFLRIFAARQAEDLASRADGAQSRKELARIKAQMDLLSLKYGLNLDAESSQFKHFNSAYRAAVKTLARDRLSSTQEIVRGAEGWETPAYDHVQPRPAAARPLLDAKAASGPALRAFFNIAGRWGLSRQEQMKLLAISASTYPRWRRGEAGRLGRDTLERISYVLGIYKALNILIPKASAADEWIKKKPSDASAFGGESALRLMLSGRVEDLAAVRRYLDAQLQ